MAQERQSLDDLVRTAMKARAAGRLDAAITAWRDVVARAPDNPVYAHNLAAALGDDGRNAEAAAIAGAAIRRGLDRPETNLILARALAGILDLDGAAAAYRRVLAATPDDAIAHREFAQLVWMRSGDRNKAEAALIAAIDANPNAIALQILRAENRGQMGDPGAQHQMLQEIIAKFGRDPQLCHYAARAALANKDFPAARDYALTARQGAPEIDDVAAVYATSLLATGDAAGALAEITRLRGRQRDNQYFIALEATAWRLLGDARYAALYDYDAMVFAAPLATPSGWPDLESYLTDLAEALSEAHCFRMHPLYLSVRGGSQIASITKAAHPAMRAFGEALAGPLDAYVARLSTGDDPLRARNAGHWRLIDAWSVQLPPDGYHLNHVHPAGWLSSACHIRPPADDPAAPQAGWLKFGEPGCATDPPLAPERFVRPEAGRMVIFPSYMWHGTVGFSTGAPRLTVAADVAPGPAD